MIKRSSTNVGIAWYAREDWPRALNVFSDRLLLPSSYDKWLTSAEFLADSIRMKGATPVKVYIDPASFSKWCQQNGFSPNAKARSEYASRLARLAEAQD